MGFSHIIRKKIFHLPQRPGKRISYETGLPILNIVPGASSAHSIRLINASYSGYCLKVRRSSDNAVLYIGFLNGELDSASIASFCGVGSGYVSIWYDQSGNANDLYQNTLANQPLIYSAGVLNTVNGKPSILFDGVNDSLTLTTNYLLSAANFSVYHVTKRALTSHVGCLGFVGDKGGTTYGGYTGGEASDNITYGPTNSAGYYVMGSGSVAQKYQMTVKNSTISLPYGYDNQSYRSSAFTALTGINATVSALGKRETEYLKANVQEIVYWAKSFQTPIYKAIYNNIQMFYNL